MLNLQKLLYEIKTNNITELDLSSIMVLDETKEITHSLFGETSGIISSLCVLSNGCLASGCPHGPETSFHSPIRIWDINTQECVKVLSGSGTAHCLAELSNGYLASGSDLYKIHIWDITAGKCIRILAGDSRSSILDLIVLQNGYLVPDRKATAAQKTLYF